MFAISGCWPRSGIDGPSPGSYLSVLRRERLVDEVRGRGHRGTPCVTISGARTLFTPSTREAARRRWSGGWPRRWLGLLLDRERLPGKATWRALGVSTVTCARPAALRTIGLVETRRGRRGGSSSAPPMTRSCWSAPGGCCPCTTWGTSATTGPPSRAPRPGWPLSGRVNRGHDTERACRGPRAAALSDLRRRQTRGCTSRSRRSPSTPAHRGGDESGPRSATCSGCRWTALRWRWWP